MFKYLLLLVAGLNTRVHLKLHSRIFQLLERVLLDTAGHGERTIEAWRKILVLMQA